MFNVLIAEDKKDQREALARFLENEGYTVYIASNGENALDVLETHMVDIIVLDVMMPKMDGITFLKEIRSASCETPVIIVSAKNTAEDIKLGLLSGADDYMTKPIDLSVLSLRLQVVLKRAGQAHEKCLRIGNICLNYSRFCAVVGEREMCLPQKEFKLLYLLLSHPGRIYTRGQIMDEIWGLETTSDDITVTTHIARIRKKFGSIPGFKIISVRGIGYKAVIT